MYKVVGSITLEKMKQVMMTESVDHHFIPIVCKMSENEQMHISESAKVGSALLPSSTCVSGNSDINSVKIKM